MGLTFKTRKTLIILCILSLWCFKDGHAGIGESEEELVFASPNEIRDSWKENMMNLAKQQEEAGNEVSNACKRGIMTCLWEDDNQMIQKAESEARARGTLRKDMSSKQHDAKGVGLPGLSRPKDLYEREELLMLAGPSVGGNNTNLGSGKAGALEAMAEEEGSQLTVEMVNYLESLEVMEGVSQGAVVKAEALPFENFTDVIERAERHAYHQYERRNYRFLKDPLDGQWQLATEFQEKNRSKIIPYNATHEQEFLEWFEKGGGVLSYVDFKRDSDGEPMAMIADENVGNHDIVLQVPMKLTIGRQTQRLVQTKRGLLKEHFDKIFQRNEEWGLACFLLYEQLKGMDSKWAPFIRQLRMRLLRKSVMEELQGTYAGELYRSWDVEATHLLSYLRDNSDGPCRHDFNGLCTDMLERSYLRWALWVVKRYAVPVRKLTTGKSFLTLVPFAHLVTHRQGAGGNMTLFLDNTIRLSVTDHPAGSAITYDKGNYSDAESLFRFHAVDLSSTNPHNEVHLALPGVSTDVDDLIHNVKRVKDWREMLRFPPSQIDLWMATNKLMIYGDQDDEEEQKVLQNLNNLFEGKPVQVSSEAEYLMLMGGAADETEAALILSGNEGALADYQATKDPMLYVAIDVENEGDPADRALDTLAYSLFQFQDSIVANSESESVQKVVNRTRDFYVHGVRPLRGFDEVDKMMKRMKQVLDLCGNSKTHVIKQANITDELFCAMRIHLVNESDLDAMCPAGPSPFNDGECNCLKKERAASVRDCDEYEIYFNTSLPISKPNEISAISALINSLEALQNGYSTSIDDDEAVLSLSTFRERNPMQAAAIHVRLKEKILVRDTLKGLQERLENIDDLPYQVEEMRRRQEERKEMEEKKKAENELMRKKALEPKMLVSVPVNIGEESHNITLYEGNEIEAVAKKFVQEHRLQANVVETLVSQLKTKIPQEQPIEMAFPILDPYGIKRAIAVYVGQNATNVTQEACIGFNISDEYDDEDCVALVERAERMHEKRMKRKVVLMMPVSLADGRSVQFQVREGDHHDLISFVSVRALVYKIDEGFVYGVANEIHKRLPPEVANIPVNVPGRTLQLSIRQGDNLEEAIIVFCELYDLPLENVPNLRQMALQKMNPDVAFVAKGKAQE